MNIKDQLNQYITRGKIVAYATCFSNSVEMNIGVVVDVITTKKNYRDEIVPKVRVATLRGFTWNNIWSDISLSTLERYERIIVLDELPGEFDGECERSKNTVEAFRNVVHRIRSERDWYPTNKDLKEMLVHN